MCLCLFACERFCATYRIRWSRQLIFNTYLPLISRAWLIQFHTDWLSFTGWLNKALMEVVKWKKSKRSFFYSKNFFFYKINNRDLSWKKMPLKRRSHHTCQIMTSSKWDYIYNSGLDVWAFVFNLFNANKARSLCMCTRTRALKEEIHSRFLMLRFYEGLVFCYYKFS